MVEVSDKRGNTALELQGDELGSTVQMLQPKPYD